MRMIAVLLALLWMAVGVHGAFSYGDAYLTYRGFPPPKDPPGIRKGRLVHERFWSPAFHSMRSYYVYEPPGYAAAAARGRRFPALYLLHGSPGKPTSFIDIARAGVALDEGVHSGRLRPFLLVMPDGRDGSFKSDTEWADTPHGPYETLVLETVGSVDRQFAAARGRRNRAIGGNSEGAYAAINIALRHPTLFSIAESWAGYATQGHHGVFADVPSAVVAANDPDRYVPSLGPQLQRYPLHAFIYKGARETAPVKARALAFSDELRLYGGHVTFRVFRGGHSWRLWRRETPRMLRYASSLFGGGARR